MAMAAGRALLGSLATKMARAPPLHHRLLGARRLHHSGPGRSSPAPSSPPPPRNEDLTQNKIFLAEFDRLKAQFLRNTAIAACFLGFSGLFFYGWFMPKLNELGNRVDALSKQRVMMKADIIQGIKEEFERVHIEVRSMQNSGGHGKEPGLQASDA